MINYGTHLLQISLIWAGAAVMATTNFYRERAPAYDGHGYGDTCYDFTEYTPTCGWKTVILSPVPIVNVTFWDQAVIITDDRTFITVNFEKRSDLTHDPSCSSFTFDGAFGDSGPDLHITWYCVCDGTTSGRCKIVYTGSLNLTALAETTSSSTTASVSTTPAAPMPSTDSTTTVSIAPSTSLASAVDSSHGFTLACSIHLQKHPDLCYIGQQISKVAKGRHTVDCGSSCIRDESCLGVNYWQDNNECHLVFEDVRHNSKVLDDVDGCTFWSVVWRNSK